ncbi:MAG: cyclic nucleotide-binding domain-containing protein [Nitrospinales bacterium]
MTLQKMEELANQHIERGEKNLAVKQIFDLILALAKEKEFAKADAWREKMIALDNMALAEILDSGEVIESEKAETLDDHHQKTWSNFYLSFPMEDGNEIASKFKQREFPPGKILIQQGKINNVLFFVDSGHLKVFFVQGEKEVFLNFLGQGNTAGQDTFFKISACTLTVVTESPVKLRFLERRDLEEIEKKYPGTTEKLEKFCLQLEEKNYKSILKNKELERRENKRFDLEAKISVQVFDKNKNPLAPPFGGLLLDVSVGGASFVIQSSNKDIGRTLLGKLTRLNVEIDIEPPLQFNGLIIGAKFDNKDSYTIKLRFLKAYTESEMQEIVSACPPVPEVLLDDPEIIKED